MEENAEQEYYEISAVSRLTGLSTHVLRVWERRYGVVEPMRTDTKRRRYHRDDIRRLTLLKSLVDNGHTISSIAKLDIPALEERLADVLENSRPVEEACDEEAKIFKMGMVAVQSRAAIRDAADSAPGLKIAAECSSLEELVSSTKQSVLDLLIIEMGSLFFDDIEKIQQAVSKLSAHRAIVIYQFASEAALALGNIEKVTALKGPVTSAEILLACSAEIQLNRRGRQEAPSLKCPGSSEIPERRFTSEQLVAISKRASAVQCECPSHLAQILENLAAFEDYSRQCENRNQDDAELHAFLYESTAKCRSRMEDALDQVLQAEGIQI